MVDDFLDPAKRLRREILFVLQLIFATFKLLFNVIRLLIGRTKNKSAPMPYRRQVQYLWMSSGTISPWH
ncbi:hypothetical protein POJ06DRAFT_270767 [Lipomyces tetrasporus]|uniref:Uncharacterized protein n=1 Tax=Lipomyces tetrasporus TaxID=54092 RepID=A0AAD7QQD5_9ASCO|nr:uncharacterized protein POJ06DRAFT_270767 [Lipomyces tetrasporus]KAJ8097952.1 hypothetical protein POJ06DRAFT_270767 [Lipomyces tetrasporus]